MSVMMPDPWGLGQLISWKSVRLNLEALSIDSAQARGPQARLEAAAGTRFMGNI